MFEKGYLEILTPVLLIFFIPFLIGLGVGILFKKHEKD
jgi:hypothetical protein